MKKIIKDTQANVSVTFAGGILALLLSVALSTDSLMSYNAKRELQVALDSAVLAAAINGNEAEHENVGTQAFHTNISNNRLQNFSLNFNEHDDVLHGTASASLPLFFGGILPKKAVSIRVVSSASVTPPDAFPCIISLNPDAQPGVLINGGAMIDAPGCEIHSHSTRNPALTLNGGADINVQRLCMAGSSILDNSNGAFLGNVETNCTVTPDPYAAGLPIPNTSCTYNSRVYDVPVVNLNPGVYCGHLNFNSGVNRVNLAPGTYVFNNSTWNINGSFLQGDDVTFYLNDSNSTINWNSSVRGQLKALTTGDYAGILFTERPGLSRRQFIFFDEHGFDFEGTIHLPSKDVTVNGGSTIRSRDLQLIVGSLILNNSSLNIINPVDDTSDLTLVYLSE